MENVDYSHNPKDLFICDKCEYKTIKEGNYKKHLLTNKHIQNTQNKQNITDSCNNAKLFNCVCGNVYKHRQGLWKHKSLHNYGNVVTNEELKSILTEILEILKHK
jgi:hypothetical protein